MNEETVIEQPQLSVADQKKFNRLVDKMTRIGQPLAITEDGKIAQDGYGRMYVRPKSIGGNVRVTMTKDGPMRVVKMNKGQRKAAKRARMAAMKGDR